MWLLLVPILIEGSGECPTPAQVGEHLAKLLPEGSATDRARVDRFPGQLRIELARGDGTVLGVRYLDAAASCDDLAKAAAVLLAAWESDLRAQAIPRPTAARPTDRVSEGAATSARTWQVDAAFVASVADGSVAPGALVEVEVAPAGSSLALLLGVLGTDSRELRLGMGKVEWSRVAFSAGARWEAPIAGRMRLDLHVRALAAALFLHGTGFASSRDSTGFDPGLAAGAALAYGNGRLRPFLGADAIVWPRHEQAVVNTPMAAVDVPRFELLFVAGFRVK